MSCIDTNNEKLIPSFTTLVLPTELPMNPSEFSKQVEQVVPEIDQTVEQIDFDTTSNNIVTIDRSPYWKIQKQVKRKTKSLEQIFSLWLYHHWKTNSLKMSYKTTQDQWTLSWKRIPTKTNLKAWNQKHMWTIFNVWIKIKSTLNSMRH